MHLFFWQVQNPAEGPVHAFGTPTQAADAGLAYALCWARPPARYRVALGTLALDFPETTTCACTAASRLLQEGRTG